MFPLVRNRHLTFWKFNPITNDKKMYSGTVTRANPPLISDAPGLLPSLEGLGVGFRLDAIRKFILPIGLSARHICSVICAAGRKKREQKRDAHPAQEQRSDIVDKRQHPEAQP